MLFSATLDNGIDVLVKRYLTDPVTHSVDSAESPVATMTHHVLHVSTADRLPVLVDLTSAPGRTMVFTRTKHRAKQLTKQLNAHGVPAVEMHGNLAQNARTRNLAAFSEGRATALVATDIAARGIHVDDVTLVIHADPPVEHKAYLHRSGRTARAGADGTVVTLATETQHGDVRQLARKAGINPTTTAAHPGHPLLDEMAPGPRTRRSAAEVAAALAVADAATGGRGGQPNSRRRGPVPTATGEAAGARSGRRGRSGGSGGSGRGQGGGGRGSGSGSAPGGRSSTSRRSSSGGGRSQSSSGGSRRG
jgi:superfamily II DNA/RNA helicase